jgi:hypothetical protein
MIRARDQDSGRESGIRRGTKIKAGIYFSGRKSGFRQGFRLRRESMISGISGIRKGFMIQTGNSGLTQDFRTQAGIMALAGNTDSSKLLDPGCGSELRPGIIDTE